MLGDCTILKETFPIVALLYKIIKSIVQINKGVEYNKDVLLKLLRVGTTNNQRWWIYIQKPEKNNLKNIDCKKS